MKTFSAKAEEVERKTYRESLQNNRETILVSKKLVTIDTRAAAQSVTPSWFNHESSRWPLPAEPSRAQSGTEREDLTSARPGATTPAEPAVAAGTNGVGATAAGTDVTGNDVAGTESAGADPAAVDATGRPKSADDAGLRPGEATERLGDFGDIAFGNLLPDAAQYSTKWEQIQFRFVDDPQGSVTEAAEVITQVTSKLEEAIQERQRAIQDRQHAIQERASALRGRWGEGSNADTETLRETLRMYKAFMDQLVGPSS